VKLGGGVSHTGNKGPSAAHTLAKRLASFLHLGVSHWAAPSFALGSRRGLTRWCCGPSQGCAATASSRTRGRR
jgi:hypothetical protein